MSAPARNADTPTRRHTPLGGVGNVGVGVQPERCLGGPQEHPTISRPLGEQALDFDGPGDAAVKSLCLAVSFTPASLRIILILELGRFGVALKKDLAHLAVLDGVNPWTIIAAHLPAFGAALGTLGIFE